MAFVHAPAVVDLNPHEIHFLQGEPKRLDCPLQHGGESDIEHVPLATEDASRFDGFHHPFFAEPHIRPSREAVLLVPGTFAVPQQYDSLHLLQPPVGHPRTRPQTSGIRPQTWSPRVRGLKSDP